MAKFREGRSSPENQGSPYVPLDSWVYPALDRLAAFGMIDSAFAEMRPWTRRECARLVSEAEERLAGGDEANAMRRCWSRNWSANFVPKCNRLDSEGASLPGRIFVFAHRVHFRNAASDDGYHFAQTQINDFGRPYGQGWNTVNGFSAYATRADG